MLAGEGKHMIKPGGSLSLPIQLKGSNVVMEPANPYGPTSQSMPLATHVHVSTRSLRIKRVDVFTSAKVMGVMYAILGLIGGLFFGVMALFGAALGGGGDGG